jgi:hypothetical protein
MNNLSFVVFTVLNLTDTGKVNNPPNPPYINLNNIIYYSNINYDIQNLTAHVKALSKEVSKYNFYKLNESWQELISRSEQILIPSKQKSDVIKYT